MFHFTDIIEDLTFDFELLKESHNQRVKHFQHD